MPFQALPGYLVGSFYLVFFFMISHHFDGAPTLTDTSRASNSGGKENSFLYKQVIVDYESK